MKTTIILVIIATIFFFAPAPTYRVVTTCDTDSNCTTQDEVSFGPSLARWVLSFITKTPP